MALEAALEDEVAGISKSETLNRLAEKTGLPKKQVATVLERVVDSESIDVDRAAIALIARHATGSFRDALGTLEQLVTYAGDRAIETADVLAVLGVTDSEQLFGALEAVIARDPAGALRAAATLSESGRDPGQA